jgi:hypothetical protein
MNQTSKPDFPQSESPSTDPRLGKFPKRFSLQQMLWGTAVLGFLCYLAIACPIYGPYQIAATIGIFVGWWLMASSRPPEIDDNNESQVPSDKRGLIGAMLIWIGVVMSLFCLPACLVEATRSHDRFRDYDLYLEEQTKFPSNR